MIRSGLVLAWDEPWEPREPFGRPFRGVKGGGRKCARTHTLPAYISRHAQVEFRCGCVAWIYLVRDISQLLTILGLQPLLDLLPTPHYRLVQFFLDYASPVYGAPSTRRPFNFLRLVTGRAPLREEERLAKIHVVKFRNLEIVYGIILMYGFTSCVVCSCCSTSSVVLVVTRGPESTTTSPSSSTTCRFTLVSICLVVVISFFFRVSHSSESGNEYRI